MQIIEKSSQGHALVPIESTLLEKRIVFLEGEINENLALSFGKQMLYLLDKSKTKSVLVIINSPGGSILSGLSIVSDIKKAPFSINVYCPVECLSMGAVIFSCATGERVMSPYSRLMMHEPLISGKGMSPLSQVEADAKSLSEKKKVLASLISEKTGKSEKEVLKIFGKDRYFSPEEALSFGLCDRIEALTYLGGLYG